MRTRCLMARLVSRSIPDASQVVLLCTWQLLPDRRGMGAHRVEDDWLDGRFCAVYASINRCHYSRKHEWDVGD